MSPFAVQSYVTHTLTAMVGTLRCTRPLAVEVYKPPRPLPLRLRPGCLAAVAAEAQARMFNCFDALRRQRREAEHPFERRDDLSNKCIQRNQLVFGDIDAIARKDLVVGRRRAAAGNFIPMHREDLIATAIARCRPSDPDFLAFHPRQA